MIRDLDETIRATFARGAPAGSLLSAASVSFDIPDAKWRAALGALTVNCYLYDLRENRMLRTEEPMVVKSANGRTAVRVPPPVRVDCAYCITAWSISKLEPALEEHRLLSQVMLLLLRRTTLPRELLQGSLASSQLAPYPTILASQEGVKNQAEFWQALDQRLKPSLNYVVTLAVSPDMEAAILSTTENVKINVDDMSTRKDT